MKLDEIIKLVGDVIKLEKKIETEIRKEKDAKKRKKLRDAFSNRDVAALRSLLFD